MTPAHFDEHVTAIRERFHPLSLEELVAGLDGAGFPRRAVVITFDDGYRDNLLTARPILERHGVPATVFVITGYTGTNRSFWWDDLERISRDAGESRDELRASRQRLRELPDAERRRVLAALGANPQPASPDSLPLTPEELVALTRDGLVEAGAHTVTHPWLPGLPQAEQLAEIVASRTYLEELLDRRIASFSYPHGEYDAVTVECVRQAGLRCACVGGQRAVTRRTPPLEIPRLHAQNVAGDELAWLLEQRLRQ